MWINNILTESFMSLKSKQRYGQRDTLLTDNILILQANSPNMTTSQHSTHPFIQEEQFSEAMQGEVLACWQQREEGEFCGQGNATIKWMRIVNSRHQRAIVVVNGRVESYWKYQELFYELYQQGYDVYALDHRGQGISDRLTENSQLGHVDHFDDYFADLNTFVSTVVDTSAYQHCFMLAHSMGGTIATRYLQEYNHPFSALALSAPMYGIHVSRWLRPIVYPLAQILDLISPKPTYAPGQVGYYAKPFTNNPLCQSQTRYRWFRDLYEQKPEMKLGGPSSRWIWQGMKAARACRTSTDKLTIPTLLMQASADNIIDNSAHDQFCHAMTQSDQQCKKIVINGARHELLFEQDKYRNQSLNAVFAFFNQHSAPK